MIYYQTLKNTDLCREFHFISWPFLKFNHNLWCLDNCFFDLNSGSVNSSSTVRSHIFITFLYYWYRNYTLKDAMVRMHNYQRVYWIWKWCSDQTAPFSLLSLKCFLQLSIFIQLYMGFNKLLIKRMLPFRHHNQPRCNWLKASDQQRVQRVGQANFWAINTSGIYNMQCTIGVLALKGP